MSDKKVVNLNEKACSVCKAEFRAEHLDKDGRCSVCVEVGLMPGVKSEQDYVQEHKVRREEIKVIVREVLKEIEEENAPEPDELTVFAEKECKICGKKFTPRTPAQARCDDCIEATKGK